MGGCEGWYSRLEYGIPMAGAGDLMEGSNATATGGLINAGKRSSKKAIIEYYQTYGGKISLDEKNRDFYISRGKTLLTSASG